MTVVDLKIRGLKTLSFVQWFRSFAAGVLGFLLGAAVAWAGNGEIALAFPTHEIVVDGDLSDWNEAAVWYPIKRHLGEEAAAKKDFKAAFRVAYRLETQSLFVAVRVEDDSHVVDQDPEGNWQTQDSHLLYVDKMHEPGGSGNILFQAGEKLREVGAASVLWDPANAKTSWDEAEVVVSRKGKTTFYEWRVKLGDFLAPYRTIGIDHLISDWDSDDEEGQGYLAFWGEGLGKSANSYRLADLIPLPAETPLGDLQGTVRWSYNVDEPLPPQVRITSVENPDLWVHALVDQLGHYSTRLPVGDYEITSAYRTSKPFEEEPEALPLRIDDRAKVHVSVVPSKKTKVADLVLSVYSAPDYLFHKEGVLPSFDSTQSLLIDNFVETYRKFYQIPGVSVALVKDGKLAYHRTFGSKNTMSGEPVEGDTLFEAASISKPVFAFAVMRLAEKGLIDLDKPLFKYLPFPNIAKDSRSQALTARFVLSHRSGLPNWVWGGPGGWENGGELELNFQPGTQFGYSGEAFNYLGRVLEAITGDPLSKILREEVFVPMEMSNAFFALTDEQAKVASVGHYHDYAVWKGRASEASPASSLHTEAKDFTQFLIGLIEAKGLSTASYEQMLRSYVKLSVQEQVHPDAWPQSISLGFFVQDTPFGRLLEHGGNNGDFMCKFGVVPESGMGYVIFTNSNSGDELTRALELFLLVGKK